jgi:type IX secretion system PorP/SprF family membrane protein
MNTERMTTTVTYGKATGRYFRSRGAFLLITALALLFSIPCRAQLNPFQAMYYENRYINNPAMAGLDKGLNIDLGYLKQWDAFPGTPVMQLITVEYQPTDKVGLGLNIVDNQEGIFRQTRAMATYAYHIPLGDQDQKLNFGLSAGVNDPRLNTAAINGDLSDSELQQYEQQTAYFDGDLGLSYTSNNFFAEAVLPNLGVNVFNRTGQRQDVDQTVFFIASSYKIAFDNTVGDLSLEPLAAYRQIKGYTNIFDAGLNFRMNDYHFALQAIYHSNDSFGFGVAFDQPTYVINFAYDLTSGPISSYTSGTFELGIKLKIFSKQYYQ